MKDGVHPGALPSLDDTFLFAEENRDDFSLDKIRALVHLGVAGQDNPAVGLVKNTLIARRYPIPLNNADIAFGFDPLDFLTPLSVKRSDGRVDHHLPCRATTLPRNFHLAGRIISLEPVQVILIGWL
jgi:hypothetical protein